MKLQPTLIKERVEMEALQSFLERNNLPSRDLKLNGNLFLVYNDVDGSILGSGGLEIYGDSALLRSVAVSHAERGKRLGKQMVNEILMRAKVMKIQSVFLLTETAYDFFLKEGFKDISRDQVPEIVKSSSEFSFVCPASAKCMVYNL